MAITHSSEQFVTQMCQDVIKRTVDEKYNKIFLRDIQPQISVETRYEPEKQNWLVTCRVRTMCRSDQMAELRVCDDQMRTLAQQPDWIHYQAQNMARMVSTGIFLAHVAQDAENDVKSVLDNYSDRVADVDFIPDRVEISTHSGQVDDRWLCVVRFKDSVHVYRNTMRNIMDDPKNFAAFLTMVGQ